MTRNQRRKSRTEQRRRWRYNRRLARYTKRLDNGSGLVNFNEVMKLFHPDDGTYYDYRTDSFRPMPPYKSPKFIIRLGGYSNWETPPSFMSRLVVAAGDRAIWTVDDRRVKRAFSAPGLFAWRNA